MESEDVSFSYETLWKLIIRPPRDDYTEKMLGKSLFKYKNRIYKRKDYSILSTQGHLLKCSFIEPLKQYRPYIIMPVVLYLHGNSSSRIEGLQMCETLLKNNINLFVFDFAGCGLSEGKYISLGYHESNDLENIINFVEKIEGVGNIGIWGRSMGAATTMIYAHRNKRIKAICLDSPFADFMRLATELVLQQITLPNFLIVGMLKIIGSTIFDKNGLDIEKLKPIEAAEKTFQPALFIHTKKDELINVKHSIDIFNKYAGKEKKIKILEEGGHNTNRDKNIKNEIGEFFRKFLMGNIIQKNNNAAKLKKDINIIPDTGKDNKELKKNIPEEESCPFSNKSIEEMEYMKKREEKEIKQINRMSVLIKSIREVDIRKSFGGDIFNLNDENNKVDSKLNINQDKNNVNNNKDKILNQKDNNNIKNINNYKDNNINNKDYNKINNKDNNNIINNHIINNHNNNNNNININNIFINKNKIQKNSKEKIPNKKQNNIIVHKDNKLNYDKKEAFYYNKNPFMNTDNNINSYHSKEKKYNVLNTNYNNNNNIKFNKSNKNIFNHTANNGNNIKNNLNVDNINKVNKKQDIPKSNNNINHKKNILLDDTNNSVINFNNLRMGIRINNNINSPKK